MLHCRYEVLDQRPQEIGRVSRDEARADCLSGWEGVDGDE